MENARRRAELYATAAGVQLGHVLRISEDVQRDGSPDGGCACAMAGRCADRGGHARAEVEVHVTYALR